MRRSLTILMILACTLASVLYAQKIDISDEIPLNNVEEFDILGKFGDRILYYEKKNQSVYIRAFDDDLNEIWQRDLNLLGKRRKLGEPIRKDGHIHLLYSYVDQNKRILVLDQFDASASRVDTCIIADDLGKQETGDYTSIISEDRSHVFIYRKESQDKMVGYMISTVEDTLKWSLKQEFNDVHWNRDFTSILVSNYGELFVLFELDNKRSKKAMHMIHLEAFRNSGKPIRTQKILQKNILNIHSRYIFDNENRRLIGVSLSHRKKDHIAEGYTFISINPFNATDIVANFQLFDHEILKEYYRVHKVDNEWIEGLEVRDIILRKDGGVLVFLETSKRIERSNYGYSTIDYVNLSSNADYYFEDVISISIHPTGEYHWGNVLRKKQYSFADQGVFSSYGLITSPSSVRIIFNDEIKRGNTVSEYSMNGLGAVNRYSIMSTQYEDLGLRFRDVRQLGPNEFVVPSEVGNDLRLVRFIF